MLKLVNLSTYKYDLERFNYDHKILTEFLERHEMNGIELLNPMMWKDDIIPKRMVKGVHLKYFPAWIDLWNNDEDELMKQFNSMDDVERYYGGTDRQALVQQYRKEIEAAEGTGCEYVVFHVSHVQMRHSYDYEFTYSDREVIDASVELINEVFKDLDTNVKLLFENLWWPGLTMLDETMAWRLLDGVNYYNKGFMLDTAHLMNTNLNLKDEKQAVDYMMDSIRNLGELKNYIKGIHLNCSLSGEYVRKQISQHQHMTKRFSSNEMNEDIFMHVLNIDRHRPFEFQYVRELIQFIEPEYLVMSSYQAPCSSLKSTLTRRMLRA